MNIRTHTLLFSLVCSFISFSLFSSSQVFRIEPEKNQIKVSVKNFVSHANSECVLPLDKNHVFYDYNAQGPWGLRKTSHPKEIAITYKDDASFFHGRIDTEGNAIISILKGDDIVFKTSKNCINKQIITSNNLTINAHSFENSGRIECGNFSVSAQKYTNAHTVICLNDMHVSVPQGLFLQHENGVLSVGGSLTMAAKFWHNQGCAISAEKDINIKTDSFTNDRLKLTHVEKHFEDCKERIYSEPSDEALLESKNGSITITCSHGKNNTGTMIAAQDITFNVNKFENSIRSFENTYCDEKKEEGWFDYYYSYSPRKKSAYTPAVIAAGNVVTFVVDGKSYKVTKATPMNRIPGVTNTGVIVAGKLFDLTAHNKKRGQLVNGSAHAPHDSPQLQLPDFQSRLIDYVPQVSSVEKPDNAHCVHLLSLHDNGKIHRPVHLLGYAPDNPRDTSKPRFEKKKLLLSEKLQAEATRYAIQKNTGMPFVGNYAHAEEQFLMLQEMGFLFGLIMGRFISLHGQEMPVNTPLGQDDRTWFEHIIQVLAPRSSMTPQKLNDRLHAVKAGTHMALLYESAYRTSPVSLLYYRVNTINGTLVIDPHIHISKQDKKNNDHPEGLIKAHDIKIHLDRVINYGSMIALNKLEVRAQTVLNQKPTSKDEKTIESGGKLKRYTIVTPQPGGEMIGIVVDIEAIDGTDQNASITNKGGLIKGKQTVRLVSGSIENSAVVGTQVLQWDPGFWGDVFKNQNASLKKNFHAGKIESDGDVFLEAQTHKILIEASKVIGKGNVALHGYLGVLVNSVMSKHVYNHSTRLHGLGFEEFKKEAYECARAYIEGKNVNVISKNGAVESAGGFFKAQEKLRAAARKDISFKPVKNKTRQQRNRIGIKKFGVAHDETEIEDENVEKAGFDAKRAEFASETGNVTGEAVDAHARSLHTSAPNGNVTFTDTSKKQTVTHNENGIGITFFGSEAIVCLFSNEMRAALLELVNAEPVLRTSYDLIYSQNIMYAIANAERVLIEAARLLNQYVDAAKTAAERGQRLNKMAVLGSRWGLTDEQGNFKPSVTLRFGHSEARYEKSESVPTVLDIEEWHNQSGNDTNVMGGVQSTVKKMDHQVGGNLNTSPGKNTETFNQDGRGVSLGTNGASAWLGADGDHAEGEKVTYRQGKFSPELLILNVKKAVNQYGTDIDAKVIQGIVEGSYYIVSPQSKQYSKRQAGHASISSSGMVAGGVAFDEFQKTDVESPTRLTAKEKMSLKILKSLKLIGGFVDGKKGESVIETPLIEYEDIETEEKQSGFFFNFDLGVEGAVPGFVDFGWKNGGQNKITRATITNNVDIASAQGTTGLNRDPEKIQEVFDKEGDDVRIVIPFVNVKKLGELFSGLRHVKTPQEKEWIDQEIEKIVEQTHEKVDAPQNQPDQKDTNEPKQNDKTASQSESKTQDSAKATSAEKEAPRDEKVSAQEGESLNAIGSFTIVNEQGNEQETIIFGVPEEKVTDKLTEVNELLEKARHSEYLKYESWSFDPETRYYYYRFDVSGSQGSAQDHTTKNHKTQVLKLFDNVLHDGKTYVVDFTRNMIYGATEVFFGYDMDLPSYLPQTKVGVYGRKLGRIAGLTYSAVSFAKAIIAFGAAAGEAAATPISGGSASIAVPATVAVGVACAAEGCYFLKNAANLKPVQQASNGNEMGGGPCKNSKTDNLSFETDSKIDKQIIKRGWTKESINETIKKPDKILKVHDTRRLPNGGRVNDPATAFIKNDGSYIVRNDKTGMIVQVSNRNDPNWKLPWKME